MVVVVLLAAGCAEEGTLKMEPFEIVASGMGPYWAPCGLGIDPYYTCNLQDFDYVPGVAKTVRVVKHDPWWPGGPPADAPSFVWKVVEELSSETVAAGTFERQTPIHYDGDVRLGAGGTFIRIYGTSFECTTPDVCQELMGAADASIGVVQDGGYPAAVRLRFRHDGVAGTPPRLDDVLP